jgi:hypothetical protein
MNHDAEAFATLEADSLKGHNGPILLKNSIVTGFDG